MLTTIESYLADKAEYLLNFNNPKIAKDRLHLPGPDVVDRLYGRLRPQQPRARNLQRIVDHGRLGGTGYLSILPVDQGIEHSGGRELRQEPGLLRRREHRAAGDRRRLQCRGFDLRRARRRRAQIRAQDSVPGEDQPQRAA